jgi:hypothetical protein
MVLCLKTRESRSLPDLPRTNASDTIKHVLAALSKRRVCICKPGLQMPEIDAGWSSPVARQAHNLKVTGSNPVPATNTTEGRTRRPRPQSGGFLPFKNRKGSSQNAEALRPLANESSITAPHSAGSRTLRQKPGPRHKDLLSCSCLNRDIVPCRTLTSYGISSVLRPSFLW